ncbi:MAG: 2-oxoglutarate and iron-dependent oxygenase domain-containing protein, partial [Acidimicrobiales bacterium]
MANGIPTIDIAPFRSGSTAERAAVAEEVDAASRFIGFFKIGGHGVSPELITAMERVTTEFFDQPESAKLELQSPSPDVNRGYAPMGTEALSYSVGVESPPDLFEAFNVGVQRDSLDYAAMAPNHSVLYHENLWPERPEQMKVIWEEYLAAMTKLAQEILQIFGLALGVDVDYFSSRATQSPDVFRAINYRRTDGSASPTPGQMRMGAHSDYGTCTLLHADPVPGLQVLGKGEKWIDVTPTPG